MTRSPRHAAGRARALGVPTRGTTNPNRLRRVDNFLTDSTAVARRCTGRRRTRRWWSTSGTASSPVTTLELAARLRARFGPLLVLGLEIDPERVRRAQPARPAR